MKLQINKQVRKKGMDQDIKLGAGGIREVEFVIQALQMVHGGSDKRLQQTSLYQGNGHAADWQLSGCGHRTIIAQFIQLSARS
jgi:[glutamine synthetase] adenylyltransferase / [glutamine synthetase]-adenylyl-L-tyrosine phosphorylase